MARGTSVGLMLVILLTSFSGCTAVTEGITGSSSSEQISVPTWELGDYWLYTFSINWIAPLGGVSLIK